MSTLGRVPEGHTGGLRGAAPPGQPERQVPFYCPYCGDEDLWPAGPAGGSWRCGACARSFELRFTGLSPGGDAGQSRAWTPAVAPRQVLAELDPDVEIIDAGKAPHTHHLSQEQINAPLVERALAEVAAELITRGRDAGTPVAVTSDGTTERQQVLVSTLERVAEEAVAQQIRPPAVVVVGEVVGLRDALGHGS